MIIRNKVKEENSNISESYNDRLKKLQLITDKFEDVALNYGPVSSEELKARIDKIIKGFDKEMKLILEKKFEQFWSKHASSSISELDSLKETEIPKFLKNYKK